MDNCIKRKICPQCGQEKNIEDFYKGRDDIISSLCKTCILSNIDNNNPDTFLKYLQELDIPYVEDRWNEYNKNYDKIFGRYLSFMRLAPCKDFRYSDSEILNLGKKDSVISTCFD